MDVTVEVVGEGAHEVTVGDDATYADLLRAVEVNRHEVSVLVDGRPVPADGCNCERVGATRPVRVGKGVPTMLTIRDLIPWSRERALTPERRGLEHPVLSFQREMDRLFDEFWRGIDLPMAGRLERSHAFVSPRIDVSEDEKQIRLSAELPGMEEKDVEILLGEDTLTISGEKKSEHEATEEGIRTMERSYGQFRRTLPIDTPIVADKVEANFKNGVLTVVLPKDPAAQSKLRKIPVSGAPALDKPEKGEKEAA